MWHFTWEQGSYFCTQQARWLEFLSVTFQYDRQVYQTLNSAFINISEIILQKCVRMPRKLLLRKFDSHVKSDHFGTGCQTGRQLTHVAPKTLLLRGGHTGAFIFDARQYLPLFSIRVAIQQAFMKRLFFRTSQQTFLRPFTQHVRCETDLQ